MAANDPAYFFKMYGVKKPRTTYYAKDFLDYVVMILVCTLLVGLAYGPRHEKKPEAPSAAATATAAVETAVETVAPAALAAPVTAVDVAAAEETADGKPSESAA